jgi:hypothetical protein
MPPYLSYQDLQKINQASQASQGLVSNTLNRESYQTPLTSQRGANQTPLTQASKGLFANTLNRGAYQTALPQQGLESAPSNKSWWKSQKPVAKVAIIGGGAIVVGFAIYGIYKLIKR